MDTATTTGPSPVHQWRQLCRCSPELFVVPGGSSTAVRRVERAESRWIEQLVCEFGRLETRTTALRSLAELRGCSVRLVATFFEVEPPVVIRALSLLHVARPAVAPAGHAAQTALVKAA